MTYEEESGSRGVGGQLPVIVKFSVASTSVGREKTGQVELEGEDVRSRGYH